MSTSTMTSHRETNVKKKLTGISDIAIEKNLSSNFNIANDRNGILDRKEFSPQSQTETRCETIVDNFIDGKFIPCSRLLDSFDPSTGRVWAQIPDSGNEEVQLAVEAAKRAFPKWSSTPAEERAKILLKAADLLEASLDEFAQIESRDQGKPVSLARAMDIPRAVHNLRMFAETYPHHLERSNFMEKAQALNYSTRLATGVAGLISPWNLPLYLLTFKLGPALVTGNTVVAKPSEMTSVTAWMLCGLFKKAGLPDGVLNLVFGNGPRVGDVIVRHPDVRMISFTGSTLTAQKIREASASLNKKLSLELGGKNPAVVFEDADLAKCLPTLIRASYANQGEICLAASRIYVQDTIYDSFLERFIAAARAIKVGDPRKPDTVLGALVSKEHLAKVRGYVEIAKKEGATIRCGEGVDKLNLPSENAEGYFFPPTVVTDVTDESRLMKEEIFGPVICIVPFKDEEEVIGRANDVQYGLSATLWTQNVSRLHRVALKLEAGTVWCNCWLIRDLHMPFGGMKDSGVGREGVIDSIEFYTEAKTVCVQL